MSCKPSMFPHLSIVIVSIFIIHSCSNFVNASDDESYFVASKCPPNSTFTAGSPYENYLNNLLSSLSSEANDATTNGYFTTNTTALGGGTTINFQLIYGAFLCRGDVSPQTCKDCVALAVIKARDTSNSCMDAKIATNWWALCMIRYSNTSFGNRPVNSYASLWNNIHLPAGEAKQFMEVVVSTLNKLAQQVTTSGPGASKKYFGTLNGVSFKYMKLYTMAQCVPDIDPTVCKTCLNQYTNQINVTGCSTSIGCQVHNPQCFVRYETYSFEESTVPVSALPAHSSGGKSS